MYGNADDIWRRCAVRTQCINIIYCVWRAHDTVGCDVPIHNVQYFVKYYNKRVHAMEQRLIAADQPPPRKQCGDGPEMVRRTRNFVYHRHHRTGDIMIPYKWSGRFHRARRTRVSQTTILLLLYTVPPSRQRNVHGSIIHLENVNLTNSKLLQYIIFGDVHVSFVPRCLSNYFFAVRFCTKRNKHNKHIIYIHQKPPLHQTLSFVR